jgi:hypothetical protein
LRARRILKMKTTIRTLRYFAALTAVLLLTAVLITTCADPVNMKGIGYKPTEGKGAIKLKLNNGSERTIMPTSTPTPTRYKLSFQKLGSSGGTPTGSPEDMDVLYANIGDSISLDVGFYILTVISQTGTTPNFVSIATGESEEFEIEEGESTDISVNLSPMSITTNAGNGTLTYKITLGTGVPTSVVTAKFTTLSGGSYATTPTLTQGNGGGSVANIPAGFYVLSVAATSGLGTAYYQDALQIYQGLASDFDFQFTTAMYPPPSGPGPGDGDIISLPFVPPTDYKPELENDDDDSAIDDTTTFTLSIASTQEVVVNLTNSTFYDGNYWFISGQETALATDEEQVTIKAGTAPFTVAKTYYVTVIGYTTAGAWSEKFKIVITD